MSPSKLTRPALACLFALGVLALGACAQKAEQKAEVPPAPQTPPPPIPNQRAGSLSSHRGGQNWTPIPSLRGSNLHAE